MLAGRGIMGEITIRQPQASFFFPQSQVHQQYAFERGPDVRMPFFLMRGNNYEPPEAKARCLGKKAACVCSVAP